MLQCNQVHLQLVESECEKQVTALQGAHSQMGLIQHCPGQKPRGRQGLRREAVLGGSLASPSLVASLLLHLNTKCEKGLYISGHGKGSTIIQGVWLCHHCRPFYIGFYTEAGAPLSTFLSAPASSCHAG